MFTSLRVMDIKFILCQQSSFVLVGKAIIWIMVPFMCTVKSSLGSSESSRGAKVFGLLSLCSLHQEDNRATQKSSVMLMFTIFYQLILLR